MTGFASATRFTGRPIEIVLIHLDTGAIGILGERSWRAADERARGLVGIVAGPGIVAVQQGTHHRATLAVSARTLATSTFEAVTTGTSVLFVRIFRARARFPVTLLLLVTFTGTGPANSVGRGKLAFIATIVVRIIADGVVLEFACFGIAAAIVTAARFSSTIAIFPGLHDTIAALAAANGHNALVI